MSEPRINLMNLGVDELKDFAVSLGEKPFRATQFLKWIYQYGVTDFDLMTNIKKDLREKLKEIAYIKAPEIVTEQRSSDGTVKWALDIGDGQLVETVLIPEEGRNTLCISTQVGCPVKCAFCRTGASGFNRNLSVSEIIGQVWRAAYCVGFSQNEEQKPISNVVMMGMGEPLDNVDEVLKALDIMTAPYGYGWSPKRVTLSSVGLRKGLLRFIEESDCHLAISLHSPVPVLRRELMPAERAFSITEIVDLLRRYDFSKQRRLSFEYIVFKGVNDSLTYAKELLKLLRGLDCRINLIRFHAIPGVDLQGADMETMTKFRDYLTSHGLFTTIRASRGEDIFAACGMLSTAKQEENKQELI